jgi:hypothetical protein
VLADADIGRAAEAGAVSRAGPGDGPGDGPGVDCLDAALWHERSTLEALVTALTGSAGEDGDDVARLLRERRMARLLSSVETAALAAEHGLPPSSPDLMAAMGGGWGTVLYEHEAALQRLVAEVDAAAGSRVSGVAWVDPRVLPA